MNARHCAEYFKCLIKFNTRDNSILAFLILAEKNTVTPRSLETAQDTLPVFVGAGM